ncbi:MAG: hypothetical protein LBB98_11825 [Treponema sp.]|jgi:hypothetical protein|nr:hypothetical protein [Treponema sp.]
MVLQKGQSYTKEDFGIGKGSPMRTDRIVGGELYSFFTIGGDMGNKIEDDGFVYEGRNSYNLIDSGVQTDLRRHVFARESPGSPYVYLGKGSYERRYSPTQNKVFW